jgi:hypothetical protein
MEKKEEKKKKSSPSWPGKRSHTQTPCIKIYQTKNIETHNQKDHEKHKPKHNQIPQISSPQLEKNKQQASTNHPHDTQTILYYLLEPTS